jgi:SAM-dependent methyltransferase
VEGLEVNSFRSKFPQQPQNPPVMDHYDVLLSTKKPLLCMTMTTSSSSSRRSLLAKILAISSSSSSSSLLLLLLSSSPIPSWAITSGSRLPELGEIQDAVPQNWDQEEPLFSITNSDESNSSSNNNSNNNNFFARLDNTPDTNFYQEARLVEHVDDQAVQIMTDYISNVAIQPTDTTVLDLCSSWVSHIDPNTVAPRLQRISGLGMNAKELQLNPVLTDFVVQDLNENPQLRSIYDDNTFDVALCQLSIDYLTRPLEVLKEVSRILKPGGRIHIFFSNRLFLSKAISGWTGKDDIDHVYTVACYLHFCGDNFGQIQAKDLSARKGRDHHIVGDPMYVVSAVKVKTKTNKL